ncbi:MAG: O-antigen ligase family protein [Pyrinomonadaceae bacterium]|nr:O-antigen ligase family protein [Pyrinomonadaceae bacterium]MCX7640849.1 O-antigen ligase family protein [Pyrinomonadaceae bacterium]MDW8303386.1 O-antigen ligase family protein [Acidobacteriota bacterium]
MKKEKQSRFQTLQPPKKRSSEKSHRTISPERTNQKILTKTHNEASDLASVEQLVFTEKESPEIVKAKKLLSTENWLLKNGHMMTYIGIYIFSVLAWFRPYELVPSLGFLSATAFYVALATLIIFVPTQILTEASFTAFPTEVKCIIGLVAFALITTFIGKNFDRSWQTFNDSFIKAAVIFVVMVNVIRTRKRLLGMIFLSLSIAFVVSLIALNLYLRGEFRVEGYRVGVEIGGMFGNPNDMALHLVTMIPIAVCLALAQKGFFKRFLYFSMAALFVAGMTVTFSRGAFLGFLISTFFLLWKVAQKQRFKILIGSAILSIFFILIAPSNYFLRLLSIFSPELDPVGSIDQRKALFLRSLYVTARNPWGIGIGNSPIMNDYNLEWHNTYMQIASELGIVALFFYLVFLISPFQKLSAIEKIQEEEGDWFYYFSVGLQASLVAYMVSSFFVSVAYNWYVYYLVAYAVALRRIYKKLRFSKDDC